MLATEKIESLYNDGSDINIVNISGDESKPEVSLNATQSIMLDNNGEYRYYGANPNNYVSFNGELWRIISSSNVKSSESDITGSQRLRIIRNESIGNHSWDYGTSGTDYDNNWNSATLNNTLNVIYYNGTSGTCYLDGSETTCDYANGTIKGLDDNSRSLIGDTLWYLGGNNTSKGLYASDWYNIERGLLDGGYKVYEGNSETIITKIGIMYPSDYTYAADLSVCKNDGFNYEGDDNCAKGDWLFNSDNQWLLSAYSIGSTYAFDVNSSGYVSDLYLRYVNLAFGIRPVTVLKPNVTIIGGSGTSGDPYQLFLG